MPKDSAVLEEPQLAAPSGEGPRTYSLVEVAQKTGIPMPILLRYKRENPDRVPSHGSGSQQRFPEEAFEAFLAIQREEGESRDLPRRGGFGLGHWSAPGVGDDRSALLQKRIDLGLGVQSPPPALKGPSGQAGQTTPLRIHRFHRHVNRGPAQAPNNARRNLGPWSRPAPPPRAPPRVPRA